MLPCGTFLILCSLTAVCYCTTDFLNLFGYQVTGKTLTTVSTSDDLVCAEACAKNKSCWGFQLVEYSTKCILFQSLTGITQDDTQCTYYVKKLGPVKVAGQSLSFIDELRVSLMYASKKACPDGWTQNGKTCYLVSDELSCYLIPSALGAFWNGSACVLPAMNTSYTCESVSFTLYNATDGEFCYLAIPQTATTSNDTQRYGYYNNICYEQTGGGSLASIHSSAENDFIDDMGALFMIGLIATSGKISSASDVSWIDGTPVDYTQYKDSTTPPTTTDFYFTIVDLYKDFVTDYTTIPERTSLLCRVAATLVLTKN
uniref:Apple domain-containing protein n=1 Tax=Panagrellus redivivus TaxID=6233 RepID=A0A7E4ZZ43_PANRE